MKYDRYEIKKVEHIKSMSEETECFSLDLYVDGKKFAHVGNDGHGGCHRIHPYAPFTHKDIEAVTEDMKKDKFLVYYDYGFEQFDTAVDSLFSLWQTEKELKKDFKTKALFTKDNDIAYLNYRDKRAPDQRLYDSVKEKYPTTTILNLMELTEAAKFLINMNRAFIAAANGDDLEVSGSTPEDQALDKVIDKVKAEHPSVIAVKTPKA